MICVYKATSPTEAHLVGHWLERNGIEAQVRGGLATFRGELSISRSGPSVWVSRDDEDRARAAIRAFDGPVLVHPRWQCPHCEADNEPNFGSCWSCNEDNPALLTSVG